MRITKARHAEIVKAARMGGIARAANLSPERRSEIAGIAGRIGGAVSAAAGVSGRPRKVKPTPKPESNLEAA